jgi:hypothetical protein
LDIVMAKQSGARPLAKGSGTRKGTIGKGSEVRRSGATGQFMTMHEGRVEAVMAAAERSGLLHEKSGRIGGRVSPALVERAKARTGIETDTDLIEFALANVALEDRFAESFKATRGKVDPDLKLGF